MISHCYPNKILLSLCDVLEWSIARFCRSRVLILVPVSRYKEIPILVNVLPPEVKQNPSKTNKSLLNIGEECLVMQK